MSESGGKKSWKIYVIHHTHTDIGYTESQEVITQRQVDYLRQAVRIGEAIDNGERPEWEGFHWVCETFWAVDQFWQQADGQERERFLNGVKKGYIEVTGNYLNLCELVDEHTLEHFLQKARAFSRETGLAMKCAMTADINGCSWGYGRLLHQAGFENLYSCVHNHHGMFPLFRRQIPFYWEAKDGSRLLVWNGDHYQLGNEMGIVPDAAFSYMIRDEFSPHSYMEGQFEMARTRIFRYLDQLESENYPYNFVPLNVTGLVTDNAPPNGRIMEFIHRWNREYGDRITMEMTTLSRFFDVVREAGQEIPVYRGDWPDWWSDGAGSACGFTRLNRQAQRKLRTILENDPEHKLVSPEKLEKIYEKLMLYCEHTFSYSSAMEEPWNDMVQLISEQKHSYAVEANRLCDMALAEWKKSRGEVLLYPGNPMRYKAVNMLPGKRRGLYRLRVDSWEMPLLSEGFRVRDNGENRYLPCQLCRTARGAEVYVELNLLGGEERVLQIYPAAPKAGSAVRNQNLRGVDGVLDVSGGCRNALAEVDAVSIETEYLRIRWSMPDGITGWYDKKAGRDLMASGHGDIQGAFTPVYEVTPLTAGDDICSVRRRMGRNRKGPNAVRTAGKLVSVREEGSGGLFTDLAFTYELPGTSYYVMILRVYHNSARAEVCVRVHKDSVWEPENLYITLPFGLGNGALWVEKTGEILRPGVDQLPGTNTDYYCLQNGYGVLEEKGWLTVAMPDTPLLWTGDMEFGLRTLNGEQPVFYTGSGRYAWVMNNFWETNFDASNGGFYSFRYVVDSGSGQMEPEELRGMLRECCHEDICFRTGEEEV